MGGGSVNTSVTRLEALNIQSSTYGAVIPWLRGAHRIPGNLVWYGDFKATAETKKTGGKGGGGGKTTTYSYSASLLMGLCHGTIANVTKIWKGKATSTPGGLGLSVFTGAVAQTGWTGLNSRGTQTLNYSGLTYVAALNYPLGDRASVENHSFEVQHASAYAVTGTTPDVDASVATFDLLTHPHQGANFPAALIGDWSAWSNYCVANKLLVSPLLTTQIAARDALQTMADLTNTGIVWSDGKLKMRPYGDASATAYGRTFTPDTTPVYQLDDNCYLVSSSEAPVRRQITSPADLFNIVKVQYKDRANAYNIALVTAQDITAIAANGPRPMDVIQADWICDGSVARFVAELRKQRALLVLGTYTFTLPINYALIECMDLLTLSDSVLLLDDVPVRVKAISEQGEDELAFTVEDYPAGVASAPLYASQGMTGFAPNANASPGDALAPTVFELPGTLTTTGLELAIATGSASADWGGCQVWVSYDGSTYRQIAELRQSSRYGTLASDSVSSIAVNINAGQQLLSGSAADATSLATLCYLAPAGAVAGEYIAHQAATLTAPGAYTLSGLVRGAYGTTQATHASGSAFVRVDDSVARSGPLDPALIGSTVYIKLTSFNVFGAGQQSLADVSASTYTITGSGNELRRKNTLMALTVTGDNRNANLAGFSGQGVKFSSGYNVNSATRGHTLVVYNPATDLIEVGPTTYDTYASGTAGLVAALAGVAANRIVALYTYDASACDAALRTALRGMGGGLTGIWSADRRSHVFIGSPGWLPGEGYEANTTLADAGGVISQQAYYTSAAMVKQGASGTNGTPGAPGSDGQTTYLHIKYSNDGGSTFTASSGETPGAYIGTYTDFTLADSSSVGAYSWALIKGADGINGTAGAPGANGQTTYLHIKYSNDGGSTFTASSGETPGAYIGTYTDFTLADSGSVGAYTWALIKGADGTNGTAGTPGSDGTPSYLHIKWSDDGGSTFTASSGETPGRYIGTVTDSTLADPTTVGAYTWALVKGSDGSNGTDGQDAIAMTLSAVAVTLPADSTGLVPDYSTATTTAKIMRGATDDTSNWSFSRTNGSGVTSSLSGAVLTVSAVTGDTGYVDIVATRSGYASQTARVNIAKAKSANPASGPVSAVGYYEGYSLKISPNDSSCYVEFRRDGSVYTGYNPSTNLDSGDWYLPNGSTVGDGYEIRFDQISSSGTSGGLSGATVSTWLALSSARGITLTTTENTNATRVRIFNYVIRDASTHATVCTGSFNLEAGVEI